MKGPINTHIYCKYQTQVELLAINIKPHTEDLFVSAYNPVYQVGHLNKKKLECMPKGEKIIKMPVWKQTKLQEQYGTDFCYCQMGV